MSNNSSSFIYAERIHQVVDYISDHISEEISLDKLAAIACFSPFHFHRLFSVIMGETPRDYIERIKLEQAANMVCVMKNKTITDIAYQCGFKSVSTFSRAFKKHHGVSPVQFVAKHKHDFHSLNVAQELRFPNITEVDFSSVEIKKLPAFKVIYIQTLEGYRTGIPKAWTKLLTYAKANDLLNDSFQMIGIPYNNPGVTPREKCRYRACISVDPTFEVTRGEVKTAFIDASVCAVYHFKGTRENITDAYAFLYGSWLIQSGYVPDRKPLLELYPLSLMADCSRNQLEYDIALPIVPL